MGQYMPTVDEYKAYHWCINNMIYISPFATGNGRWYIDIQIINKKHRSPDTYGSVTIWVKMYEYYKYYYIKYANKV